MTRPLIRWLGWSRIRSRVFLLSQVTNPYPLETPGLDASTCYFFVDDEDLFKDTELLEVLLQIFFVSVLRNPTDEQLEHQELTRN